MSETKKNINKKEDEEKLMKDLEQSIIGDVEDTKEVETKPKKETKKKETVEEHIFKDSEKQEKDIFAEKATEAAATAALKAAIEAKNEMAIRESEQVYFVEKKNHMLKKCKNDKVVTRTISKFYAPYLGKVYTFLYNGIPVTIYCDGKPHEYPEFIANKIDKKLLKVADSNTYKEIIDERLDQDTF